MRDLEHYTGLPSGRKKTRRGRGGSSRDGGRAHHDPNRSIPTEGHGNPNSPTSGGGEDGRRTGNVGPNAEGTGAGGGRSGSGGGEDRGRARMAASHAGAEGAHQSPSTGGGTGGPRFRMQGATQGATMSGSTGAGTDGTSVHPATAHLHAAVMAHNAGDHQAAKTHALNYAHTLHVTTPSQEVTGGAPAPEHFNLATGEISDSDDNPDERENHDIDDGEHAKHFIAGAIKHPGALHRELGVPEGQKIPAKKLTKAEHSSNPTERKRAILARTLKHMHH